MILPEIQQTFDARRIRLSLVVVALIGLPTNVFAQADPEPSGSIEEGRVIYSREVPYGSAIGPRTPYREHSVVTGPTNAILSSMATGLTPLGDDENAGVVAGTNSQAAKIENPVARSMGLLNDRTASTSLSSDSGNLPGSSTGTALGQMAGTIQNVMGTLRNVLGGGE